MPDMQPAMQPAAPYPYLRLMRLHQPTGIWLVYWPCVWALALATITHYQITQEHLLLPMLVYMLLFFIGAVVMRSAGCIVNDMADREFDKHVERTKARPLASGELDMRQAGILLFLLCLAGLAVLGLTLAILPPHVDALTLFLTAIPVTALIVAYPFMKRITWWPQAFLGLTFNWGVLISWVTIRGTLEWQALALYAACFFWTLAYDTIYGHQDKQDDVKIGIKSTSQRLEKHRMWWIGGFYAAMTACYAAATGFDLIGMAIIGGFAAYRLWRTDLDTPASCHAMFRANARMGLLLGAWLITLSTVVLN